jgi:hypothetical protein
MRAMALFMILCCTAQSLRSAEAASAITPRGALTILEEGNRRFVQGIRQKPTDRPTICADDRRGTGSIRWRLSVATATR